MLGVFPFGSRDTFLYELISLAYESPVMVCPNNSKNIFREILTK